MSSALELIQAVEAAGGRFIIHEGRWGIVPAGVAEPAREELRRNRAEIIELLSRRPAMPPGVRLLRWEPKLGPVRLSRCEIVTDIDRFVDSTLQQLVARLHGDHWHAGNWAMSELLDRLAVCGCHVALINTNETIH